MSRENLTHAIEDYLKVIYELTLNDTPATTNSIAGRMGVTPASVTGMIKRLAANDPPLLYYNKHRGVQLTPAGERAALEIIRHHRLLEAFLHERLGYGWDEVHAEADRLEHVISEALEERIARALGDPPTDPHGSPIPSRELYITAQLEVALSELRPGQQAIIHRVDDSDPELLRYLGAVGLVPQAQLSVLEYSPFDSNLSLKVSGHPETLVIGERVTRQIFVEILPEE